MEVLDILCISIVIVCALVFVLLYGSTAHTTRDRCAPPRRRQSGCHEQQQTGDGADASAPADDGGVLAQQVAAPAQLRKTALLDTIDDYLDWTKVFQKNNIEFIGIFVPNFYDYTESNPGNALNVATLSRKYAPIHAMKFRYREQIAYAAFSDDKATIVVARRMIENRHAQPFQLEPVVVSNMNYRLVLTMPFYQSIDPLGDINLLRVGPGDVLQRQIEVGSDTLTWWYPYASTPLIDLSELFDFSWAPVRIPKYRASLAVTAASESVTFTAKYDSDTAVSLYRSGGDFVSGTTYSMDLSVSLLGFLESTRIMMKIIATRALQPYIILGDEGGPQWMIGNLEGYGSSSKINSEMHIKMFFAKRSSPQEPWRTHMFLDANPLATPLRKKIMFPPLSGGDAPILLSDGTDFSVGYFGPELETVTIPSNGLAMPVASNRKYMLREGASLFLDPENGDLTFVDSSLILAVMPFSGRGIHKNSTLPGWNGGFIPESTIPQYFRLPTYVDYYLQPYYFEFPPGIYEDLSKEIFSTGQLFQKIYMGWYSLFIGRGEVEFHPGDGSILTLL